MTGSNNGNRGPSKRARFMNNYSGSTSDCNASLDNDRSTPSFNHASSRCVDSYAIKDHLKLEESELNVRPIWLEVEQIDRFLLLEDTDTGDILMPLSRLKEFLGDNYSRSLNNTDSRFVVKDSRLDFGVYDSAPHLFWMWPFESPAHVKSIIKQELKDHSTGHIRLVPVPVVYSAMSKVQRDTKSKRLTPTFLALLSALDKALHASNYAPILHTAENRSGDKPDNSLQRGSGLVFAGPTDVAQSAAKYMTTHRLVSRKKAVEVQAACQMVRLPILVPPKAQTMSCDDSCMTNQAKKLDALEESLHQTKSMFAHLFQLISSVPRSDPVFSQVRDCLTTDQEWNAAPLQARYSTDSTPKSQVSQAYILNGTEPTPSHTTCIPQHLPFTKQQQSIGAPLMPMNQAAPVTQTAQYPSVASRAHHPNFPSPQTPGGFPMTNGYVGRDKQSISQSPAAGQSRGGNSASFGECHTRCTSYRDVHDGRLDMPTFM